MSQLAAMVDVSQPFISQIENDRAKPSLSTLNRLARALDVAPGDLMARTSSDEVRITRAQDGALIPTSDHPQSAIGRVLAPGRGSGLEFIEYRVDPREHLDDWFEFPGELVVYVVEGELEVEIAEHGIWRLGERDSMHHDSAIRHRWRPIGDRPVYLLFAAVRHDASAESGA
jgi:transcriptional regulator with XRE-family HTH domain